MLSNQNYALSLFYLRTQNRYMGPPTRKTGIILYFVGLFEEHFSVQFFQCKILRHNFGSTSLYLKLFLYFWLWIASVRKCNLKTDSDKLN